MRSNFVLIKYFKKLSSLFEKLIDKAFEEKILILSVREFFKEASKFMRLPKGDMKTDIGAVHFPNIGMDKIIVINWPRIKKIIFVEPGLMEIGFAHEISHNLTWKKRPKCAKDCSVLGGQFFITCAYFEILADYEGLRILKQLRRESSSFEKPVFRGREMAYSEILRHYGLPERYIRRCRKCRGIKSNCLKRCPKEKEIEKLVKAIERCKI